jgi:hypothetical protein
MWRKSGSRMRLPNRKKSWQEMAGCDETLDPTTTFSKIGQALEAAIA